jgi:hypothetical protein
MLVLLSVHLGDSPVLLAAGGLLGVLALTARGPLGLVRVCGPRLHAVFDVAAGVLLALSPLFRALRPGVLGIAALELVALVWLRMTMVTRYTERTDSPGAAPDPATTTSGPVPGREPGSDGAPVGPPLSAFRELGRLTATARRRLPDAQDTIDSGARRIGGHAGRLHRAWRRTTD